MAQLALLHRLYVRKHIPLHTEAQDLGASHTGALPWHCQADYFFCIDQCRLWYCNVRDTSFLYIFLAHATKTENRSLNRICYRYFVCEIAVLGLSTSTSLTLHSACLTSILRTEASFRIVGKHDQTYELIPLAFWSSVLLPCQASSITVADFVSRDAEMASGIICGCMPVVPQFFRHFLPKIKSHFSSSNRSKAESASRGIPFAATPVVPWDDDEESHKLKGKDFDVVLHSLDQTSDPPQGGIKIHARGLSEGSNSHGSPARDLESCLNR